MLLLLDLIELTNVGPTEAIDRLLGVADEELPPRALLRDRLDDVGLERIVVLELIDEDALESLADALCHTPVFGQQVLGADQ